MAEYTGNTPRISGLFEARELPQAGDGWENRYSQSGKRSLFLCGDAVVPAGFVATMECYDDALSSRSKVKFAAGTRLRVLCKGDAHSIAVIEAESSVE